jgi:hypothetical protein
MNQTKMDRLIAVASEFCRLAHEMGLTTGQINQRAAFTRFTRSRVTRWVRQGKILPKKQQSRIYYDLDKLIELSQSYEYMNHT